MARRRYRRYLVISELGERVDDDTEDDVEADGGDDDEEGEVKDGLAQVVVEGLTVGHQQELEQPRSAFRHAGVALLQTSMHTD